MFYSCVTESVINNEGLFIDNLVIQHKIRKSLQIHRHENNEYLYPGWISLALHLSKRNRRSPAIHQEDIQQSYNLHHRKRFNSLDYILYQFVPWLTQESRTVADKFTHYAAGVDEINNVNIPLQEALVDNTRIEFYRQHLFHIQRALK